MIKELNIAQNYTIENELVHIIGGHIFFQTVNSAVKFKLFDLLEAKGGLSIEQIAAHLNIQLRPTRILLLGLTALNLLEKNYDSYINTKLAIKYFTSNSPENLISVMEWQAEINYHALGHLHESMISGKNEGLVEFEGNAPTLYERLATNPRLEGIFQDAMEDISKQANTDLANYIDFSNIKCLVDIGGGNGSNIISIAKQYNKIKAIVFDRKTVCEIAKKNIFKNNLQDRCLTYSGNCFVDEFPKEADAYIFCHFMTIWTEKKDQFLLKKAYDSLPEGGKVYIFNMMQNNTEDGPLTAAMGSPYFLSLATAEGMLYTWKEYSEWMANAGFKNIETIKLPKDHGVLIGYK